MSGKECGLLRIKLNLNWIIGRGDIVVSLDKWLNADIPYISDMISVKQLFLNEHCINTNYVQSLFGHGPYEKM